MVHKPEHKVHSFRGLLGDGAQEEINLERQNVNLAFRIVKFNIIPYKPFDVDQESVVKVYKNEQSSITDEIDFTDTDLLAVAIITNDDTPGAKFMFEQHVIFDNVLFSRNIYVTHRDQDGAESCNYYIELEEVPVGAATLMQLKLATARKLSLTQ